MLVTRAALFLALFAAAVFPASSQNYPTRPIALIVPFSSGTMAC